MTVRRACLQDLIFIIVHIPNVLVIRIGYSCIFFCSFLFDMIQMKIHGGSADGDGAAIGALQVRVSGAPSSASSLSSSSA